MYDTILNPDFHKLHTYFPNTTEADIANIKQVGGVPLYLDYMNEERFLHLSEGFKVVSIRYDIQDHYDEMLFLIIKKNEQIAERYVAYWQNYNDDQTSSEVAKFLLAFKESKPIHHFQLVAKPITGSVAVKDSVVAKWMMEQIYKAVEAREFPLDVFGEKLLYDLFGEEANSDKPISLDRLKATSMLHPRKPTVRVKKLYVEFCLYLQVYLINQTQLTAAPEILLTDAQANFFFDVLELLGYLNKDSIQSEPKDYIHAMFRNYIKLTPSFTGK